ncbi:MAG: hypothetical protein A3G05_00295 [Candidatus Zambryskibacteria bacterium RIFCSPLOWO2_12_FULL_45_14]|uniref:Uncharacterized protein n=2 Tax=Candidatus Zambryskiibacteriota TaxID=1817925 RepID=A0A1G2ULN1_9BACT|nr:MAG: hypothetical protein A3H60_02625 [Candidatus Zambryskibacteria bacterium RIFCSPLOWO2_02_FULL_44_12b]OHB13904.1 MAG: hypothetical protein A3G05_00295 [Candidatus Zambryskibacteria bacterium RIFCSPLOWO2_12_FULL_45_14]
MPKSQQPGRQRLSLDRLSPAERRQLERLGRKWHQRIQPMRDAIRESERITAEDLAVAINTRTEDEI